MAKLQSDRVQSNEPIFGARRGIKSFEDLYIFKEARELTNQVYAFTRRSPASSDWAFVVQIRRSAVSVLSNIAEGFDRQTRPEFIQALFIARGSAAEVRAQLLVALDQKYVSAKEHEEMTLRCRRISAGIFNLIRHLRRSIASKAAKI